MLTILMCKILLIDHIGEMAPVLITPLQHTTVGRLHPAVINPN